jgi:hypothetical protein
VPPAHYVLNFGSPRSSWLPTLLARTRQ